MTNSFILKDHNPAFLKTAVQGHPAIANKTRATVVVSKEIQSRAAARAQEKLIRVLAKHLRYDAWKFQELLRQAGWPDLSDRMIEILGPPPRQLRHPYEHQEAFDIGTVEG